MDARTTNRAVREVIAAFEDLGLSAQAPGEDPARVTIRSATGSVTVEVVTASVPAPQAARRVAGRRQGRRLLVADRIGAATRSELNRRDVAWLDRRGHLRLVAPDEGIVVDTRIEPLVTPLRADALAGAVGREVAVELLLEPTREWGVRALAGRLDRSASAVSVALRDLREESLVDGRNRPLPTALFAAVVERWSPQSIHLAMAPTPNVVRDAPRFHGGLDDLESEGWALTGALAAAAWHARLPLTADYPPDLYVPDGAALRFASDRFGVAPSATSARATVIVAPVQQAVTRRYGGQLAFGAVPWPLAHPLLAAIEIARDPSRGPEVLESWTPPSPFHRVW